MALESSAADTHAARPQLLTTSFALGDLTLVAPDVFNRPGLPSPAEQRILNGFGLSDRSADAEPAEHYLYQRNEQGFPTVASDGAGNTLRRYAYESDGRTLHWMRDETGNTLTKGADGQFRWFSADGFASPVPLKDVSVDRAGNLHWIDDSLPQTAGRNKLEPNGNIETHLRSRERWKNSSVEQTHAGMVVRDENNQIVRSVTLDASGRPAQVVDSDGCGWTSRDGGRTITRHLPNGASYRYDNADMRVDNQANITYRNPYGETITETNDGRIVSRRASSP